MAHLGTYAVNDESFPRLIQKHRLEYPDTEIFENVATKLVLGGFEQNSAARFVRQICRWGGYYGVAGRVLNHNTHEDVAKALRGAWDIMSSVAPNLPDALCCINQLRHLGRPSFASKFLRFLSPTQAPILDGVISHSAGISMTVRGYGELVRQCHLAEAALVAQGIRNPVRRNGAWPIADIEAAFYASMREL